MLPSTGYFKAINCPFYESGSCDRPYCHFKHSKREDVGFTTESIETVENRSTGQVQESKPSILSVVSQVVEELKPTLITGSGTDTLDNATPDTVDTRLDASTLSSKSLPCVYNPTPIAELKKRHIPIVSYMPTRESRIAVKRKCSPDQAKPWLNTANECIESLTAEIKYKPTMIINSETRDTVQSYVPTCKSDPASSNMCNDGTSNEYLFKLREAYYPKSKKRREEYVPKKVKAPLKKKPVGLNESTLNDFITELDNVLASSQASSEVRSCEVSLDSSIDLEGKFSDDEYDNNSSRDSTEDCRHGTKKINTASIPKNTNYLPQEQLEFHRDSKESPTRFGNNDCAAGDKRIDKVLLDCNRSKQENVPNEEVPKGKALEVSTNKGVVEYAKEHKSGDKGKGKDRKEHDASRKRSKDRHDLSEKKSHSSSRHKSKSSKESKSKKHEKYSSKCKEPEKHRDKDREKEKEKEKEKNENRHRGKKDKRGDHYGSGKRHEHDSRNHSRKQEHAKSRNDDGGSRRSKTDDKSDGTVHVPAEKKKLSAISLESVRLNLEDDDNEGNDHFHSSAIDNGIDIDLVSTSDSDHDVQEECLKIFQEYQVPERTKATEASKDPSLLHDKEKETIEEIGRKRVAHPSAAACVTRQIAVNQQTRKSINPQQKMYERWRMMREAAAEKTASIGSTISKDVRRVCKESMRTTLSNSELRLNGNGRVRIAHVPYAKSLAIEKKKVTENVGKSGETKADDSSKTAAQTSKSGVRVAHVPQVVPQLIRPEPLHVTTQKFPLNVRQYYVNMMHDVCVLIYTNGEDAAQRALKEEYACHERCKALAVYKNSCMLAAHRLRKEVDQNSSVENNAVTVPGNSMSHEAMLAGKGKGTWSVLKTKKSVTEFRGTALYGMLKKWILSEQQLKDNGFPRAHPDGQKGRAKVYVINSRNQTVLSKVPNERMCSRCGQSYMVDKQGIAVRSQNCIYHWGRKFTIRGEGKYSCCQQYGSASGCCDAKSHVWDYTDYENLRGYVKTLPKDTPVEEQGVYALDCEMCYTTQGLELTRITVIDDECGVVYETLVMPQNPITDYNTRFSGITEECMRDVTTTLLDVQATLLTMFSDKTILVGHSLESDFKALRLLHDTVVDTSIMFPHKNGYPQKRALKNLCSEYLRKLIQNDVGGHDSKEDAIACMELVLWKAKEEAKLQ